MNLRDKILSQREEIFRMARMRGAKSIRIFGSAARGDSNVKSDIDFLVELETGRSLLDLGGLQMDLQDLMGLPVDVVTEAGLRARIRETVLSEAIPL